MNDNWLIFCEESGDKCIPWKTGSSHYYIVSAVLVKEVDEHQLINTIVSNKHKILRMRAPLEWKKLDTRQRRNDKLIAKFLNKVDKEGPEFLVTNVICQKHETNGPGLVDTNRFMNFLYGLMFKKISWFLKSTNSTAKLIIDRNTDKIAQESLRNYLSDVARFRTGEFPRFSKPKWINPETHAILGFSDFISGVSLRSLTDYYINANQNCKLCGNDFCIYTCFSSNFSYSNSFKYIIDWNEYDLPKWQWRGLIYHPFEFKDNYRHIFVPK